MITITDKAIDPQRVLADVSTVESGATVLFLGTTRRMTDGKETRALEYQCYREMAEAKLAELETEARRRWAIQHCRLVHRVGPVPLGEASVAVAVSTAHRRPAFEAAQWLIDTLKEIVPIWKKEIGIDGTGDWVHPGVES